MVRMTIKTVITLSLMCASISFTVTETKVFEPLREWLKKKSKFLGELISCGYCFGHWTAFALTAVLATVEKNPGGLLGFPPGGWQIADYFLTALVIAWFSGFQWAVMCILVDKTGK